jgi:N-acetylglucosaminyldiphosphoundecaprenol N-acetyl-beta-D-mannosaminyltransferase
MSVAARPRLDSIPLLGVRVDHVTMEQTLGLIEGFVRDGQPHQVITLDASMAVMAEADMELRAIVCGADLVVPDSAGILWACHRAGIDLTDRVSGVDIVSRLCERSAASGLRLFFLGAGPGVAEMAAQRLRDMYPNCAIVGTWHGYFAPEVEPAVIDAIRKARPDVVFVAFGIPKQEKWIAKHRDDIAAPVMVGVGGSFDVLSGRVKRAPVWVQRLNAEWLYRLAQNPPKLGKVMTLPRFALMVMLRRRHIEAPV